MNILYPDKYLKSNIVFTSKAGEILKNHIKDYLPDKIFLLVDENTLEYCYPIIKNAFSEKINIFKIRSGEENKTTETLFHLLDFFEENKADKKSVLINLGGGVISDLGGFAACIFKRGFAFVNIPTTLLSQVDASIGGKTGVNYNGLKNEIGVIREPDLTIIDTSLLKTLDSNSILSGFAEMLKHGLIHDETHFEELLLYIKPENLKANTNKLIHHIEKSISIKNYYIEKDLNEEGIRKALNFGHTFGHAIESLYFELNKNISHGKAVAYGMICELFISNKKLGFNQTKLNEISEKIISFYGKIEFSEENKNKIIEIIKHDKKNFSNIIYCTLLKEVGVVEIQQVIDEIDIEESIKYLNKIL